MKVNQFRNKDKKLNISSCLISSLYCFESHYSYSTTLGTIQLHHLDRIKNSISGKDEAPSTGTLPLSTRKGCSWACYERGCENNEGKCFIGTYTYTVITDKMSNYL